MWDMLLWVLGLLSVLLGVMDIQNLTTPFPAEFLYGASLVVPGGALALLSLINIGQKNKNPVCLSFVGFWGGIVLYFGIFMLSENWFIPDVECPEFTYSRDCLPCLRLGGEICSGHGECDVGLNGTGVCFCDVGWDGDVCNACAPTHKGEACERCKRQWMEDEYGACSMCRFGYEGGDCQSCSEGFLSGSDEFGALCDQCLPNRYGASCTLCPDCTSDDVGAVCRSNDWQGVSGTFTSSGLACEYNHECDSGWCRGYCDDSGRLCYEDDDCDGVCVGRTCGLEFVVGDGTCECSRTGYVGDMCSSCPNFDGVYSSSICGGHGACAVTFSGDIRCECQEGWSGEMCGCHGVPCYECAEGFFGSTCEVCPGGSGIQECSKHGRCNDGLYGDGTCSCDKDDKPGGIGMFDGASCTACQGEFWGSTCGPCPDLAIVADADICARTQSFLDSTRCYMSCQNNECFDGVDGNGTCV